MRGRDDDVLPSPNPTRRRFMMAAGLGLAASVGACSDRSRGNDGVARAGTAGNKDENLGFAGSVLAAPLPKPTQVFTDTSGDQFDIAERTAGKLSLLFFGYTSCPDVCPVHLGILASALKSMSGPPSKATVMFVGVDTARDTPAKMRTYLDSFDPAFIGLTALPETIDAALVELDLPATVIDDPAPDGSYAVGHASQILVYGPDNLCHIVYPFGTRTEDWARDLPRIIDFRWPA